MIPKIKTVLPLDNYILQVSFDSGEIMLYNVKEDIDTIPSYKDLETINGLFNQVQIDESRTCIFWTDLIDLPSDIIFEYGTPIQPD